MYFDAFSENANYIRLLKKKNKVNKLWKTISGKSIKNNIF